MGTASDQQFHLTLPESRSDDGLFGPDSISWKVWSHPAVIPGVMRSFVLDMIASPHGAAAMEDHSRYREDPLGRLNRTLFYFLTVVFADTTTVTAANRRLDRLHARIVGTEPMGRQQYSAMDPYLRLGNHMLSWHSVLYAYDRLVGGLTPTQQDRFFAEAAIAFGTLGVDQEEIQAAAVRHGLAKGDVPSHIPCTRAEYRQMWSASKHLICVNKQSRSALDAILHPRALDGDRGKAALFRLYPVLARTGIALIPQYIRHTAGLPASSTADAAVLVTAKAATSTLHRTHKYTSLLRMLCPQGYLIQTRAMSTEAIGRR